MNNGEVGKVQAATVAASNGKRVGRGGANDLEGLRPALIKADLPAVELPGGDQRISDAAAELGKLLDVERTHFVRGGTIVRLARDDAANLVLSPVRPAELASDVERVAQLTRTIETKKGSIANPTNCSESAAKLILAAQAFAEQLPPLRDLESGVLAQGEPPETVSLTEAKELLLDMLAGFRFASPSDRSRALAALITPAMVLGGLLPGRAPVDLGEADQSQSGKGFRNKLTAAIYCYQPVAISQQHSGVGSLEESFDRALIAGQTFIALDNMRGKIDSQKIESFLTEDTYYARCAYTPNTEVNPRRVYVMFTSNKADMTADLANRCSCVRILKQPDGYQFPSYAAGDVLEHVQANQPRYLGAVFAVIRAWHAAGKPRTGEARHDFRAWAQTLDWIVQNLLDAAPLMDGHRETQKRMTNPAMNWLREVALAVVRQRKADQWLIAADLLEVLDADGSLDVPGLRDGCDIEDEGIRKSVLQQIGRKLKRCFDDAESLSIDRLVIERESFTDYDSRQRLRYRVRKLDFQSPPDDEAYQGGIAQNGPECDVADCTITPLYRVESPDAPPDSPLIAPLMISREPADPPNTSNIKDQRGGKYR